MPDIIILRGTPNSGKSSIAALFKNAIIVSADDYFTDENGNYNFDFTKIGAAHRQCQERFLEALKSDCDTVIVANTNVKPADFKFYEQNSGGNRVFHVVVERRHNNFNSHGVPQETIDRMENALRQNLKLK